MYSTILQSFKILHTYYAEDKDFSETFARQKLYGKARERNTAQRQQRRLHLGGLVNNFPTFEKTLFNNNAD